MGFTIGRSHIAWGSAFMLALALGCGGGDDSASPEGADAGTMTMDEMPEGTTPGVRPEVVTGELPDGYPTDIPPPPGAKPGTAIVVPGQSGLVSFTSDSSREDVFAHFKSELEAQGWSVESDENEKRVLVKAVKGDRKTSINIPHDPRGFT
jgi:hypothetical protein